MFFFVNIDAKYINKLLLLWYYFRQEFIEHGLDDIITIQCRDASTGFGLKNCIDAGKIS